MDAQHALTLAGEILTVLTGLVTFLGTVRNGLTHLGWISTEEATKFGKFLDRVSWVAEKGKTGLAGVATLPGFASKPVLAAVPAEPPKKSDAGFVRLDSMAITAGGLIVLWALIVGLMSLCGTGCATSFTKPDATASQKLSDDALAAQQVLADIKAKCPKLAPIMGLISKAVAVAANPYDLLSDVETAIAAIPDLKQDYDSVKCALTTVLDDYRKLKPTPATAAKIAQIEAAIRMLDDAGVTGDAQCASPPSR